MMEYTKKTIREAVEEGELGAAIEQAKAYALQCNVVEIINSLSLLSARFQRYDVDQMDGVLDHATEMRTFVQINRDLLLIVDRLPDEPLPLKAKKKPLELRVFKNRVFYALCLTKVFVIIWLIYQHNAGGYNQEQLQSVAAILAPAFAAYLSVMLADYLRQTKQEEPLATRYVNGPLITFAYWLFPIYGLLLWWLIKAKPAGLISFGSLTLWIGLVESVLGGYIGQIVQALFKKE